MIRYEPITPESRAQAIAALDEHWGGTLVVVRGKPVDVKDMPGFCALDGDALVGIAMYALRGTEAELMVLTSMREGLGIGSALIELVARTAKQAGCTALVLVTTNDNLNALRLYQKRGFDMIKINRNAMDVVRQYKPYVPALGEFGIPLRHEIEMERTL